MKSFICLSGNERMNYRRNMADELRGIFHDAYSFSVCIGKSKHDIEITHLWMKPKATVVTFGRLKKICKR